MPIFTSLLFFFIALALLPLALRNSGARELRRQRARDVERMAIAARICESAARGAFDVELDHSTESIERLDALITNQWSNREETAAGTQETSTEQFDSPFILSAYVGDVFVRSGDAEWRWAQNETFLYFRNSKRSVSPFELLERKLAHPEHLHLEEETSLWLNPIISQDSDAATQL